ncbi:MAG: helix-turn-helix domain-containing protein [Treponema sp.]|nr:helix-turn-helix domain-containing protein [Treponema sp.]
MTNKSLAQKVNIAASNIGKGIKTGSSPSAETAVKIANVLNVSVEYLITGKNPENFTEDIDLKKVHKYARTLEELENIPENLRLPILNMISEISKNS